MGKRSKSGRPDIEKWVSMDFITEYLDAGRETVLQWIGIRDMPAHKVGRQWKFKISEVDAWIKSGKSGDMGGDERGRL
jgi:excisionase family DNA binding protein